MARTTAKEHATIRTPKTGSWGGRTMVDVETVARIRLTDRSRQKSKPRAIRRRRAAADKVAPSGERGSIASRTPSAVVSAAVLLRLRNTSTTTCNNHYSLRFLSPIVSLHLTLVSPNVLYIKR
ncbi:hypothetical protein GWI33_006681 [Rhynchophorus ferrugineus]|uniref:Uncharacterized protein n=1 Tax=Rhynchophorus ferrugineus TaxID=354439 RepID=A0A834IGN2_RHYFE|nr:hypothetical protein GWI33_006681 [Rhynchophorus ferrugineus]